MVIIIKYIRESSNKSKSKLEHKHGKGQIYHMAEEGVQGRSTVSGADDIKLSDIQEQLGRLFTLNCFQSTASVTSSISRCGVKNNGQ